MRHDILDLYTDYLITSTKYTTATGLAKIFDNEFSHDAITRFLSGEELDNKKLWTFIKPFLRSVEKEDSVLIVDDTIFEKPYTDESGINTYHYDHSKGKSVKGINAVNLIHETDGTRLPLSMSIVHKDKLVEENGKQKRKSSKTKNELFQGQFLQAIHNEVQFDTVLADIWFGNIKNMQMITSKGKEFIMPLKTNRQVCFFGCSSKGQKEYVPVKSLELEEGIPVKIWLKGYNIPLLLCKQIFKNKDGSTGVLYLAASDLTATYSDMTTTYQRRWAVETYHRSLKNNVSVCASPTKTIKTQCNHIYASVMAFVKLEAIKIKKAVNQYALKSKLYLKGMKAAFDELNNIKNGMQLKLDF
jgi:DDE superfamily endonuclease